MDPTGPRETVEEYLRAYDARELQKCLDFFADDAVINFAAGIYRGRTAIEEWHHDRFKADLRIIQVDRIVVKGDTVVIDAAATSRVAKAWKFPKVDGRATFTCQHGKIKQVKFGLRSVLPLEAW